jgi:BlaI family penicillinase repressor
MARPRAEQPTQLELEILQVLWEDAPLPVRDVRRRLAGAGRVLAHTSVITVLNIMVKKGYVKRAPQGNAFLFAPRLRRRGLARRMVRSLVERVFGGSVLAVVEQLLETKDLDAGELAQIRDLIRRKAKEPS